MAKWLLVAAGVGVVVLLAREYPAMVREFKIMRM